MNQDDQHHAQRMTVLLLSQQSFAEQHGSGMDQTELFLMYGTYRDLMRHSTSQPSKPLAKGDRILEVCVTRVPDEGTAALVMDYLASETDMRRRVVVLPVHFRMRLSFNQLLRMYQSKHRIQERMESEDTVDIVQWDEDVIMAFVDDAATVFYYRYWDKHPMLNPIQQQPLQTMLKWEDT